MIAGYATRTTWLHRIPASAKLAALAALGIITVGSQDWRWLLLGLCGVLALYASLGREISGRLVLLRSLLPFLLAVGIIQGWTSTWPEATASVLRVLLMVALASLITLTTTMQAMMAALAPVFSPLSHVGINPRAPALAIALVLRFVPVLLSAWQQREEAWRARTRRRLSIRLVPVFLAEVLVMADHVTEALDARGFDLRTPNHPKGSRQ